MGVLTPIVCIAADFLAVGDAEFLHRCTIRTEAVCGDRLGAAMPLHQFLHELQCSFLITLLGRKGFQHLALMIDRTPKVVHLAVDLHVDLIEMPVPLCVSPHCINPLLTDLGSEHRPEPVPPKSHRLVADVDATLREQILDVSQRKRGNGRTSSPRGGLPLVTSQSTGKGSWAGSCGQARPAGLKKASLV